MRKEDHEAKGILVDFDFPLQRGGKGEQSLNAPCKMCVFGLKYFRVRQKAKHL